MEITLLRDIVIIFALSTLVNFLFTRIRVPTLIGYLLTGIIAGPHLLQLIGSQHEIELMAEVGVVLLMFTIGLEFSLNHLLKIRKIVLAGGFMQLSLTAVITMLLARAYDMNWSGALFIGFLTALSSTAVVLKLLQERSELTSNYGRTVLGILIFQDLVLVPLLLFTPVLGGEVEGQGHELLLLGLKTVLIVGLVYVGNKWLIPKVVHWVALTRNQELFLMSILLICLSVAFLTYSLGMSLAFGAFIAGLMISESEYSHNAFGHLIPFKDTFTSFFFVSVGMLLDLRFVGDHYALVAATVLLVIVVKAFIAGGAAFVLGHTFRGVVMVGIALSQVGEFSFILAKIGLGYHIINDYYYQLFLAVALITMAISPFLIRLSLPFANALLRLPLPRWLVEGLFPLIQIEVPEMQNHLVFIGRDSRSHNLAIMARLMKLPYISIVFDPDLVQQRQKNGEMVVYGDALNEPILLKAHADKAEIVVVSVGNLLNAMAIIERVRHLNKHAHILVRTRHVDDIEELYRAGASQVIPEEFETSVGLFERILSHLLIPKREINTTIEQIRNNHYGIFQEKSPYATVSVFNELPGIEIIATQIEYKSLAEGHNLIELELRKRHGVTLVALLRGEELMEHPDPHIVLQKGDIAYILGRPEQLSHASELFVADKSSASASD